MFQLVNDSVRKMCKKRCFNEDKQVTTHKYSFQCQKKTKNSQEKRECRNDKRRSGLNFKAIKSLANSNPWLLLLLHLISPAEFNTI